MMNEQVDVLMATYQGESFVEEQLESILLQTHPALHLVIRDDGSTDQTLVILQRAREACPENITLLDSNEHQGINNTFSTLIQHSHAPYIALADQDDKWLSKKIEESFDLLKSMERQYGSHLPLLVHTDLSVVDSQLNAISPSFWRYEQIHPHQTGLNRMLVQNAARGCTMLMNRCLANLAAPIPADAIMHDWWIALVASCFGHIQSLNKPTVLYRQHNKNTVGAKCVSLGSLFRDRQNLKTQMGKTYAQASIFLERFNLQLPNEIKEMLKDYLSLESSSFFKQKQLIVKHGFYHHGLMRNLINF